MALIFDRLKEGKDFASHSDCNKLFHAFWVRESGEWAAATEQGEGRNDFCFQDRKSFG